MSEYTRSNAATGNLPCFLSPHYLTDPEDSHLNTNARIPTSPYQYHSKFDDIQSVPPPPPPLKQLQQYSTNTNYNNTPKTLLKSGNNTPNISPIPETPKQRNYNRQQTRNINRNPQQRHTQTKYQTHKSHKQKRRASQPQIPIYPTMSYEPFAISPSESVSNSPYNSPINLPYTKREINEIRMKHYNQIYQTKKAQKHSYRTRRHSVGNKNMLIPAKKPAIIKRSYTCHNTPKSTHITHKKCIQTHTKNSNKYKLSPSNSSDPISTSKSPSNTYTLTSNDKQSRKTSTTTISRRKSQSQTNKIAVKKHRIQRRKSYDTSYDDATVGIYTEDQEIKHSENPTITSTEKLCKSPIAKQKRKNRRKSAKKSKENEFWTRDKYESDALNKQILRVRHGDGESTGQRVVTFSRRKSVGTGGKLIGFESPNSEHSVSRTRLDLEKKIMRLELDEEREKLREKEKEYETLKKQYESEYAAKCETLQLREDGHAEKEEVLLQNEVQNDVLKERLLRKEKLIHKQQHEFAKETDKFDCVISDFYFYQKTVNAMCNTHISLMNKWMEMAQNMAGNIKKIVAKVLKCNILLKEDVSDISMEEISDFEAIYKLQSELENIPRPQISKQQSMECEMRLKRKWRSYLSVQFEDEYINGSCGDNMNDEALSESDSQDTDDTNELLETEIILNDKLKAEDDDDIDRDATMIENIMSFDINNQCKQHEDENEDDLDNNSFIRNKQHRRSSAFIKTATFLDNVSPFWSLQYDSQEEVEPDEIEELDLSRNSNSSAVVQCIEDVDIEIDIGDNDVI